MMDCISLSGIVVETLIGILSYEREVKQPVVIDLKLYGSFERAAKTDNIGDAVDYKELSDSLKTYVSECKFHLLEKLAEQVAQWLLRKYPLEKVQVAIQKPKAVATVNVGVCIERHKN